MPMLNLTARLLAPTLRELRAPFARETRPAQRSIYTDTPHRRSMRALLDGAGLAGCEVRLGFWKACGELRYMRCLPVPGCDETARYVTVQDLDLTAESGRVTFRRVDLDTIVKLQAEYSAATGN